MVGDSPANDVVFGKKAGVATALVDSGRRFTEGGSDEGADVVVDNIAALAARFHERFELPKAGPLQKYDVPLPDSDAGKAAAAGDLARLEACDDVASSDASGNTPLIWAADSGAADCVPYLRDRCDVNHRGYLGATAVCRAARKGHLDALQLLLKADGVDVNAPNDKMQSPLQVPASPRRRRDRAHSSIDTGTSRPSSRTAPASKLCSPSARRRTSSTARAARRRKTRRTKRSARPCSRPASYCCNMQKVTTRAAPRASR